jgi:Bacterial EndoU nuclease
MAALEKFGPDISKDAEWIAKTDHAVEAAHNFDWDHVLRGEIKRGDAKGYHAESSADGSARIKPGAEISYHDAGVYEAKVEIWNQNSKRWKDKFVKSSFFPADWSVARIKYEVIEAFKVRESSPEKLLQWVGTSPSGIRIEGYAINGTITFYPKGN